MRYKNELKIISLNRKEQITVLDNIINGIRLDNEAREYAGAHYDIAELLFWRKKREKLINKEEKYMKWIYNHPLRSWKYWRKTQYK